MVAAMYTIKAAVDAINTWRLSHNLDEAQVQELLDALEKIPGNRSYEATVATLAELWRQK